jgi:hypothetical protein
MRTGTRKPARHEPPAAPADLEQLLRSLSRKFYAKLQSIAEECQVTPAEVLNEGAELYRQRYRLFHGPLAAKLEALWDYSQIQGSVAQLGADRLKKTFRVERARQAAEARAEKYRALSASERSAAREKRNRSENPS